MPQLCHNSTYGREEIEAIMANPPEDALLPSEGGEDDSLVRRTEFLISSVLRGGVILSAITIAIGAAKFYFAGSPDLTYPNGLHYPSSLSTIWFGLTRGDPVAIVALGLVLLLATPVVRVAVSIIAFAISRDVLYVGITLLVLIILIFSLLSGLGGG